MNKLADLGDSTHEYPQRANSSAWHDLPLERRQVRGRFEHSLCLNILDLTLTQGPSPSFAIPLSHTRRLSRELREKLLFVSTPMAADWGYGGDTSLWRCKACAFGNNDLMPCECCLPYGALVGGGTAADIGHVLPPRQTRQPPFAPCRSCGTIIMHTSVVSTVHILHFCP